MKNLKKRETSEVKNVEKSSKKEAKKSLHNFHFPQSETVIQAESYEKALEIHEKNNS